MSIEELSDRNKCIIWSFLKGYRFKDGKIISHLGKELKLRKSTSGYYCFSYRPSVDELDKRVTHNVMVHRLVAYEKFGMKIFEKGLVVRHLDGNPLNNNPENIDIGTQSDNMMDKNPEERLRTSLIATEKQRRYTDEQVRLIREDSKIHKMAYPAIMKKWDIPSKGSLSYIINHDYRTKK